MKRLQEYKQYYTENLKNPDWFDEAILKLKNDTEQQCGLRYTNLENPNCLESIARSVQSASELKNERISTYKRLVTYMTRAIQDLQEALSEMETEEREEKLRAEQTTHTAQLVEACAQANRVMVQKIDQVVETVSRSNLKSEAILKQLDECKQTASSTANMWQDLKNGQQSLQESLQRSRQGRMSHEEDLKRVFEGFAQVVNALSSQ